jgi:hypothetical protein
MRAFDLVWRALGLAAIHSRSALQRLLARGLLAALLRHALGLGFQIGRVIALIGDATAAIEFENPAGHVVEEVAVMGDDQHRAGIFAQVLFQPGRRLGIQMVGRLIEQQKVGLRSSSWHSATRRFSPPDRLSTRRIARRAAQRVHRLLDLAFQIPQVLAVDES